MIGYDSETKLRIKKIIETEYKGERYALLTPLVYYAVNMGINAAMRSGKVQLNRDERADVVREGINAYCRQDPDQIPLRQRLEYLKYREPKTATTRLSRHEGRQTGGTF